MATVNESIKAKSPYKRGADDGLIMGIVLIIMFLAMAKSYDSGFARIISVAIFLGGVPGMTYGFLARSFHRDSGLTLFSSMWVQGIVMFFCGTLMLALFEYVYMRWINPTFLLDLFSRTADIYSAMGTEQGKEIGDMIHAMIKQNLIPGAISVAIETIWLGVFTGSLLSALMAGIVKLVNKRKYNNI